MRCLSLALLFLALAASAHAQSPLFVGPAFFWPAADILGARAIDSAQVGSTSIRTCQNLCFSTGSGLCDAPGTMTVTALPQPPFNAQNFRKGVTCGNATPVTLPTSLAAGESLWYDVTFAPTAPGRFVDGVVLSRNELDFFATATPKFPCTPNATTACLAGGRFKVTAVYQSSAAKAGGAAQVVTLTSDTAYLWFFTRENVEVFLKVLDACGINQRFWVYAAGATDRGVTITVTDTTNSVQNVYSNPLGKTFVTRTDIDAFDGCP